MMKAYASGGAGGAGDNVISTNPNVNRLPAGQRTLPGGQRVLTPTEARNIRNAQRRATRARNSATGR